MLQFYEKDALIYKNGKVQEFRRFCGKKCKEISLNVGPMVYCSILMTENVLLYKNETE